MSTSSKRYKGSKFIIAFLIGMAIFGAVGFAITYWIGQSTGPYFKQRFEEQKRRDAEAREKARTKDQLIEKISREISNGTPRDNTPPDNR